MSKPIPSKYNSVQRLINKIPISCIVDVGVQDCTLELLKLFPDKTHYLIEPVPIYFPMIKENYREIDHLIIPHAMSDKENEAYLVMSSLHKNGIITRSHIRPIPPMVDGNDIVECKKIKVFRFDQLEICHLIPDDFLCKIDVDGQDLNVARGFGEKIKKASVVIIETTPVNVPEKLTFFTQQGFALFDIVDLIYYGISLYQFDLVFIRKNLITQDIEPPIEMFKQELWHPFLHNMCLH